MCAYNIDKKSDVVFFADKNKTRFRILVQDNTCRIYSCRDLETIAAINFYVGGLILPEYVDSYIEENQQEGFEIAFRITVPHFNHFYNLVKSWYDTGKFDIYDYYYDERPWYE